MHKKMKFDLFLKI